MHKLLSALSVFVLLGNPAYGQPAQISIRTPECVAWYFDPVDLGLRRFYPSQYPVPIEIEAYAPLGAQTFEFSLPGFTEAGILVGDLVPNPEAAFAEGNPFAEGARISFATCQSTPVQLYSALLFNVTGAEVPWIVAPHRTPSEPGTSCPTASSCGGGSASCVVAAPPTPIAWAPQNPSPADGAKGVSLHPEFNCSAQSAGNSCCADIGYLTLYLGEDPDPPIFCRTGEGGLPFMELPDGVLPPLNLKPSTTYYWRVSVQFCDYLIGPIWSFTTAPPNGVEPVSWSIVKQIFR